MGDYKAENRIYDEQMKKIDDYIEDIEKRIKDEEAKGDVKDGATEM